MKFAKVLLRPELVFLLLTVFLGLAAGVAYWVSRATVLTVAVAPRDGTEPALIQAYADALAKRHKEIRLKILPFDDVRDSAAALQEGRADLAVVRPDVDLPDEALQDPIWFRSEGAERGRDACRIPVPWSGDAPPYGFTTGTGTWLPMPEGWAELTAKAQASRPGSMQSLYREALALRASSPAFEGEGLAWLPSPDGCLAFRRDGGLVCLVNLSGAAVPVPEGTVLLASGDVSGGQLPPDTALWLIA